MGFVPPPLQLTEEEFNKRWAEGKRTLKEIDPEFYKWLESDKRYGIFMLVAAIISITFAIFFICLLTK